MAFIPFYVKLPIMNTQGIKFIPFYFLKTFFSDG